MLADFDFVPRTLEDEIRVAAIEWIWQRSHEGTLALTREEIEDFRFNGERFRIQDTTKGIRRPAGWAASLTVSTAFKPKKHFGYEDRLGSDGLWYYAWEKGGADVRTNAGLRNALDTQVPLIGLLGIGGSPAAYQVIAPIRVLRWLPEEARVVLAPFDVGGAPLEAVEHSQQLEQVLRQYLTRETKIRVHQPYFRQLILRAYENHCAICSLRHPELLDAAHIIPDSQGGEPTVTNGLALCKIHHSAYDQHFLGVDADYKIHVRPQLLHEVDGPMLRHGLQEMHGTHLRFLPAAKNEWPNREALGETFKTFQQTKQSA